MSKKKPDPASLPFRKERILSAGLLALLAPLPLPFSDSVNLLYLVLFLAVLGTHLLFVRRGRILVLPNFVLNLAGFIFFFLAYQDARYGSRSLLKTTVHILLFTTVFKFLSVVKDRDFSTILVLVAFLFVGAIATSFHVTILPFIIFFALLAWTILVRWALWRDLAAVPEEWTRDPRNLELPGRSAALTAVGAVFLIALPFFIILPRIRQPFVRGTTGGQEVWTGFSESVDPGITGRLKQSEKIFMRVETNATIRPDAPEVLRFRALTFSKWDGRTWVKQKEAFRPLGGTPDLLVPLVAQTSMKEGSRYQMTIDLTPLNSRFLPLPPTPVAFRVSGNSLRAAGGGWIERDRMRNVRLLVEPSQNIQYEVLHGGPIVPDLGEPPPGDASREAVGSARVAAWAREVGGSLDPIREPFRFATRMEAFLSTRFTYSLDIPMSGASPLEEFLFERKEGHCEAFATAMALALREVGVPARFATGFLGGEEGLFQRYYLVRGRNAHAWVEVWTGTERGWVAFDPTPAAGRPIFESVPWTRQVRNAADSVVFFYDRYVLSFGQTDQASIMVAMRDAVFAVLESLKAAWNWIRAHALLVLGLVLLVSGMVLLPFLRFRRTGRIPKLPWSTSGDSPALTTYRRLQKTLRTAGAAVTPASAPGQVLESARGFGPLVEKPAAEIVRAYLLESFGGRRTPESAESRLGEFLGLVATEVKAAVRARQKSGPQKSGPQKSGPQESAPQKSSPRK
ncbi:MAG: DUF3488 domain-containing protein [Acidobacteria bacterium]|nr:DUF3488 domain-containing protein [Acidobacteriota bacterium]